MNFKCLWNIWGRWVTSNYIFFPSFLCVSVQTHGYAVTFILRGYMCTCTYTCGGQRSTFRCCALGLVHLGFCDRVSHWELDLPDWVCLAVQGTRLSFHFCYPSSGIIIVPPHRVFYLVARNRTQVITIIWKLPYWDLSPVISLLFLFLLSLHCVGDWIQDTMQAEQFYQWVLLQSTYC